MKKLLFFVFLFITLFISFIIFLSLPEHAWEEKDKNVGSLDYVYHFVVNAQLKNDIYWEQLGEGAKEAAKSRNIIIQYVGNECIDFDSEIKFLEMAIASRIDGIITRGLDDDRFNAVLNKAAEKEIPVITVGVDAPNSKRVAYVGTSNYDAGLLAARRVFNMLPDGGKIAIITGGYELLQNNTWVNGFVKGLDNNRKFEVKTTLVSNMSILESMDKAQSILKSYPEINIFYCTDSIDTVGVARAVVDLNKVNSVKIIGFGNSPEILRYVEKGVVNATVAQRPSVIGKLAVENLYKYKKGERIPKFIDTGMDVITYDNVKLFYR